MLKNVGIKNPGCKAINCVWVNIMSDLIKAFGNSLLRNSVDPSMDFNMVSLDALIENSSLVEGTPVIKEMCSAGKSAMSLSDKLLCKRIAVFLQSFNRFGLPQVKKDKHVDNLDRDKNLDSEYEHVLIFIEQCLNILQVQYLGCLYAAYWNTDFNWDRFFELAEANLRMFAGDYAVLQLAAGGSKADFAAGDNDAAVIRLASLGLIVDMRQKDSGISLTGFGIDFSTYLELGNNDVVTEDKSFDEKDDLDDDEDPFADLVFDQPIFAKLKTEDEEPVEKTEPVSIEEKAEEKAEEKVEEKKDEKPLTANDAPVFASFGLAKEPEAEAPEEKPEPAEIKTPEVKKPDVELPAEPAFSSPFKPIEPEKPKVEAPEAAAPQAVPEYSPFKPSAVAGSSDTEDSSPFKMTMPRPETEQPKPQTADPSMFHLTASSKQEIEAVDGKSGSTSYKTISLGDKEGGLHQGTAKLGSYLSMDDDGGSYQEQTKLGSFSSLGSDEGGEKLPQRAESPSRFFPMNSSSSNGASSEGSSRPSPFKKSEPAKPEAEAPKAPPAPAVPSPFKPLGSNDSNGTPKSPFKPLGS